MYTREIPVLYISKLHWIYLKHKASHRTHNPDGQVTDSLAAKLPATLIELLLHILSEAVHDQEPVVNTGMAVPALCHVSRDGEVGQLVGGYPAGD